MPRLSLPRFRLRMISSRNLGVETAEEPDGSDDPTVDRAGIRQVVRSVGFIGGKGGQLPGMGRGARARKRIFGAAMTLPNLAEGL